MRIIALMNQKGGVGKTTTTVNLGAALAERGMRVCLLDLDPQAHLSINYGVEPSPDIVSLYNVLVEDRPLADAFHVFDDRITLVPSSIDLAAAEIELVSVLGREMILKKRLEVAIAEGKADFDFILLDCPPSLGLLTINALAVAHEVVIPMQPHFLALQGVGKLLETVALIARRMNPKLKVAGIVLTMFDSQTKHSNEVVADLNKFIEMAQEEKARGRPMPWSEAKIYKSKIRRNIKLAESPSFGQTILKYEPTSNGAADYRALAREMIGLPVSDLPALPALPESVGPAVPAEPAADEAPVPPPAPAVTLSVTAPAAVVIPPASPAPPPARPRPARAAMAMPPGSAAAIARGEQPPLPADDADDQDSPRAGGKGGKSAKGAKAGDSPRRSSRGRKSVPARSSDESSTPPPPPTLPAPAGPSFASPSPSPALPASSDSPTSASAAAPPQWPVTILRAGGGELAVRPAARVTVPPASVFSTRPVVLPDAPAIQSAEVNAAAVEAEAVAARRASPPAGEPWDDAWDDVLGSAGDGTRPLPPAGGSNASDRPQLPPADTPD